MPALPDIVLIRANIALARETLEPDPVGFAGVLALCNEVEVLREALTYALWEADDGEGGYAQRNIEDNLREKYPDLAAAGRFDNQENS